MSFSIATRAQQAQLLSNETFQQQVMGSLLAAAAQVIQQDPAMPNHQNRLAWANAIYSNPQQQMLFFIPGMLTNSTVAGDAGNAPRDSGTPVDDNAVDYVVASLFNIYANQYAGQQNIGVMLQLGH